jgi:hypothetical protein
MYNNEESIWFSQPLITHKDSSYNSEGFLRVSLSFNTTDYNNFSNPNILFSIKNNLQKSVTINYANALDLVETMTEVFKTASVNGSGLQVDRRYTKNEKIYFSFYKISDERVVKIIIQSSETDLVSIVIPLKPTFIAVIKCIKQYTENYFNLCSKMLVKTVDTKLFKNIEQIPQILKGLPSQIISRNIAPGITAVDGGPGAGADPGIYKADKPIDPDLVKVLVETGAVTQESLMNDFNTFLGKNIDNITIPHLEETIKKVEEETPKLTVESVLVSKMLKNDLSNFEILLNNVKMSEMPIIDLAQKIKENVNGSDDNFTMFPGVSNDDLKSIVYLSTLEYRESELNNIMLGKPIPMQARILRYNPTAFPEKNMSISYDLFLISNFLRLYRRRMEGKTPDLQATGATFYYQMRCFTDPFIYSFIDRVEPSNFKSLILNRFKQYDELNFFKKYHTMMYEHNLEKINENDILIEVETAIDKIIGKMKFVDVIHNGVFEVKGCSLPSKNSFSLEQITKELIPLEVSLKLGKDPKEVTKGSVSNDVYKFLIEEKSSKNVGVERKSNLEKFMLDAKNEIPDDYLESFLQIIRSCSESKFDFFKEYSIPLTTLGERIIKALYIWDPAKDGKLKTNYKYFCKLIEDELMTKELILAKDKPEKNSFTGFDFSSL